MITEQDRAWIELGWQDELRNSHGEWTTVANTAGARKEISRQLDEQGLDKMNPLRGVFNDVRGNHLILHRGQSGKIDAGIRYDHRKRDKEISLNSVRVLPQRQGIGSRMLREIVRNHPTVNSMMVHGAVHDAKSWYAKNGAVFTNPFSSVGEWSPSRVKALREGTPVRPGAVAREGQSDADRNKLIDELELAWHFDPLEHRDAHGQWAVNGAPAAVFGSPTTAKHVVVFVPGTGSSSPAGRAGNIDRARGLKIAMDAAGRGSTAAVTWGYDAPGTIAEALHKGNAEATAGRLRTYVNGIKKANPHAHVTVIGHSYGSTVAGMAAKDGMEPDDLVFVGSPGVTVRHASELGVSREHIWAGDEHQDPIGRLATTLSPDFHGNPDHAGFGALRFGADVPGEVFPGWKHGAAHSSYFHPGSQALTNMTNIATGRYHEVTRATDEARLLANVTELAAWQHEERDAHGRWTHIGGGLEPHAASLERHGFRGRFEGYDPLRPSMAPADRRKPLDQSGRPDGAGTPEDPVDVQGDMGRAVQLMASGKHVRLNGPQEINPLLDEVDRQATAQGYSRGNEPAWDLGNISVKGTRLFNEQTLGIPRNQMPQLSGPARPGSEAALLAGGANRFIELDSQFRAQLKRDGIDVKNERVPAGNLRATQSQLTAATVAGITKAAESGNKAVRHMLSEPIWVTSDNYVLDGHHRWASDEALAFSGHGPKDIGVQRIGLPARLAVPYALSWATKTGIGTVGIGNSALVQTANLISSQVLDLTGWHDAWRHDLRGPDGEWMSGGERVEQGFGKLFRAAATPFVGPAPKGEEYPGQFSDRIIRLWKGEDDPKAKQELNLAGAEWDGGNEIAAAAHLRNAARLTPDANKASRYSELAANMETDGQTTAELKKAVTTEATPASRDVPDLLHSHHEIWNGKVDIYTVPEKPQVLAEMGWDGTLSVQNQVANALRKARLNPDQPVKNPDAFEVLEHEMIHGVVQPGTEASNERAYTDFATAQIEEGFTELGAIHHAPDFLDKMGIGDRASGMYPGHTVREQAVAASDPAEIANGNAWRHYGSQTKDAQDWVQQVAKEEGVLDMRLGTPGHDRVVALTDEVNRQGAAGKILVMARQLAVAMSRNSPIRNDRKAMADLTASIQQSIHDQWNTDAPEGAAKAAFASARHTAVQNVQEKEREMQERAA